MLKLLAVLLAGLFTAATTCSYADDTFGRSTPPPPGLSQPQPPHQAKKKPSQQPPHQASKEKQHKKHSSSKNGKASHKHKHKAQADQPGTSTGEAVKEGNPGMTGGRSDVSPAPATGPGQAGGNTQDR